MQDISFYGGSWKGRYHDKAGKPCHQSACFQKLDRRLAVVVVADGTENPRPSEDFSASAIAFVKDFFMSTSERLRSEPEKLPRTALELAAGHLDDLAASEGYLPNDLVMTLTIAVFDYSDGCVYTGYTGEGEIIGLREDGRFEILAGPMEEASAAPTYTLTHRDKWVFGRHKGPYVSILCMTDGLSRILMPSLLHTQDEKIYVRMAAWLSDMKFFVSRPGDDGWQAEVDGRINHMQKCFREATLYDLTLAVAIRCGIQSAYISDEYYKEPEWKRLRLELDRNLYPPKKTKGGSESAAVRLG